MIKLFRLLYFLRILKLFPQYFFHYEVRKFVKKGDVVIDIGANQGIYTKIFSDCGAFIFAIEPLKQFNKYFKKFGNCHLSNVALGGEEKPVRFNQWRNSSGAYEIAFDDNGEYEYKLQSYMVKGSELFNPLPKINFIKIDVEGSELPIIEDMAELILKHKPTILIETDKIAEVLSYLKGYEVIKQVSNDYLIGVI